MSLKSRIDQILNNPNRDYKTELAAITEFVEAYRKDNNINPTPGYKLEPSCIAFGEGHNLLYCQLMTTTDGDADWHSLKDDSIRKLVIYEIKKSL